MSLTTSLPRGADDCDDEWDFGARWRDEGCVLKEKSGSVREMAVDAVDGGDTGGSGGGDFECERERAGVVAAVEADAESGDEDEAEASVKAERRVRRGGTVVVVPLGMVEDAEASGIQREQARRERKGPSERKRGGEEGNDRGRVGAGAGSGVDSGVCKLSVG